MNDTVTGLYIVASFSRFTFGSWTRELNISGSHQRSVIPSGTTRNTEVIISTSLSTKWSFLILRIRTYTVPPIRGHTWVVVFAGYCPSCFSAASSSLLFTNMALGPAEVA